MQSTSASLGETSRFRQPGRPRFRLHCRAELPMRVLAIPGSLRRASTNNGLLRAAISIAPHGMQITTADISQMPLYNDDLWQSGVPEAVTRFRKQIEEADALIFSVPEYNYSLPGPLKNAIDWASRNPNVFAGKPGTMIGAYNMRSLLCHEAAQHLGASWCASRGRRCTAKAVSHTHTDTHSTAQGIFL